MIDIAELKAGSARLVLAPTLGGGIARLDVDERPVLRPWSGDEANPFSLASNILVPFSNRIGGGGFDWDGVRHAIKPNLPGEPFPIHGDGFQKPWTMTDQGAGRARLTLVDGEIGPWRYVATQDFALSETGLRLDLEVTNTGENSLPFGVGFHPWFPRDAETRLFFEADGVWMEDSNHLPTEHKKLDALPTWRFAQPRQLPSGFINNAFTAWRNLAQIDQGRGTVSVKVTASPNLATAIVYSPDDQADFFCFEPVSHPVNAVNLPGYPGLIDLEPGQALLAWITVSWAG
jgi:aldose 1-epimerase